ncbi:hypothetical protein KR222_007212, partial [Zaprionus bogoriensis]
KVPWYFASGFLLFWLLLFFAVVIPFFYRLPTALTMEDAENHVFIAERAYKDLYTISNIGTKMVGSKENEVKAVEFLLQRLNQIKEDALKDYFDIEIDVSQASGQFVYSELIIMYQGVQNIAVKLTPKNCTSESYLLVNSHFDSKPDTPSAGDDCFMVSTMLEVLRVMATTKQTFLHPIVFLFNGAEESFLLASHGFMNQHKWASKLKAVVNLDAAGSGGREVLYQSGPGHAWLVNYYKKFAKHPFGTTLGEEIFQSGALPSDSDFRIFKEYMPVCPGLDMGQCINGYIYHTKYDVIDVIPRESLQNTGDNVLSVIRGLANATELYNTEAQQTGNAVYFDFLGIYFIHYSESTGVFLNFAVAGTALLLVFLSMWRMATVSHVSVCRVFCLFIVVLAVQTVSIALGLIFPILVVNTLDTLGHSLTYYSTPLLVVGLYVLPSLIGLSLPTTIYFSLQRNDKISITYHLQLALHAQAIILSVLTITLTGCEIRSSYIFVIPLIFYITSLALNLMTTLHDRGYAWTGLLKLSQVIPFLYSSYLFYLFIVVLTPMGGRAGSSSNWDIYIAVLTAIGTVLSFGFLIPLINTFRRPSFMVFTLFAITGLAMYLASRTQLGFPYRPKTSAYRALYIHVRNKFYDYDGTLSRDESGYLFNYQDRREEAPLLDTAVNLTGLVSIQSNCNKYMMCGVPLYDFRFVDNRLQSKWLPRSEPVEPPGTTKLEMLGKTVLNSTTVRFVFNLTGPAQMNIFIQPYEDVEITDWSFLRQYLENPPKYPLSYHICFHYGIDSSPLNFFIEISKPNGDFNVPLFQLGISGHYVGYEGDTESKNFAASFPSFTVLSEWPAVYQRYIF